MYPTYSPHFIYFTIKQFFKEKKRKYEPPVPTRIGKRTKRGKGPDTATKLPQITPYAKCRLKFVKFERVKDYILLEEEFIRNQERLKPQEDKHEVRLE